MNEFDALLHHLSAMREARNINRELRELLKEQGIDPEKVLAKERRKNDERYR